MISPADLAGYQAKAKGKRIPPGKTTKKGQPISAPEEQLAWQLTGAGLSYRRYFPFHPRRKWDFDFALPAVNPQLVVAVQGKGRHQRLIGFQNDCEKHAEAMAIGYIVLPVTPRQITQGKALHWIQAILAKFCRK